MPKFKVEMCRIGYGFKTFEVEASTRFDAEEKAYEDAGNYEYPEKSSNYEIDAIEERGS